MDVDYHDYPCHTLYSAHKVKRVGEIYHVTHVDNHVTLVLVVIVSCIVSHMMQILTFSPLEMRYTVKVCLESH